MWEKMLGTGGDGRRDQPSGDDEADFPGQKGDVSLEGGCLWHPPSRPLGGPRQPLQIPPPHVSKVTSPNGDMVTRRPFNLCSSQSAG